MPRLNITEFDRTLLPYSIQARYESGKMTEEELQKYMSETGRALTAQRIQGNTTVPQKSELELNTQQQQGIDNGPGIASAAKDLLVISNDISNLNNELAGLWDAYRDADSPSAIGDPMFPGGQAYVPGENE